MSKAFEDLLVWQKSIDFSVAMYKETRAFPADEKFSLVYQLRRASVSVASNIAEGSTRGAVEFRRFLDIALGSTAEIKTQLIIAQKTGYITEGNLNHLTDMLDEIGRMINGLKNSLPVAAKKPKLATNN